MRVSSNQTYLNAYLGSQSASERLMELNRQLSTGKKYELPSDNPLVATQSRSLRKTLSENEQFQRNITDGQRFVASSGEALDDLSALLQRIRTLAVQAANDTYGTVDRAYTAKEVNSLLENALEIANTRVDNRSIFSGSETTKNAFEAVRDANGEIIGVNYKGDQYSLTREVEQGLFVEVTQDGLRAFGSSPEKIRQQLNLWDGSGRVKYADRELSAAFLPSGGVEGYFEINGVKISYDLDGTPQTEDEGDSLIDLAQKINGANAGVTASVEGRMRSTVSVTDPSESLTSALAAFPVFKAGAATINGVSLTVEASDTLVSLRDKINTLTTQTNVTAQIVDSAGTVVDSTTYASAVGPFSLELLGGAEIGDTVSSNTNVFQKLGLTRDPATTSLSEEVGPPGNLTGQVIEDYRLVIKNNKGGLFEIQDLDGGTLLSDLGLVNSASSDNGAPPNNIPSAALVEGGTIFSDLINLRTALREGTQEDISKAGLEQLDRAIDAVNQLRTDFGTRSNRLQTVEDRLASFEDNTTQLLSDTEDVDLSELIVDLDLQLSVQQAALKASAALLDTSLLSFL